MGQYFKPIFLKKDWKYQQHPVAHTIYSWDLGNGLKLLEHGYVGTSLTNLAMHLLATAYYNSPFAWVGDYADEVNGKDLYEDADFLMEQGIIPHSKEKDAKYHRYKYLVNFTKREYCIVPTLPPIKNWEWRVHSLCLLTNWGNENGGGCTYRNPDDRVGRWKFDNIGATNDYNVVRHFKRISGIFES